MLRPKPLSQKPQMPCHSDKPTIYYMHARIAFKKRKAISERVLWIVSVFDNPADIMAYDSKTMHRLRMECYGKNSKAEKQIIIREVKDKISLGKSNLTIDEHKKQNKK